MQSGKSPIHGVRRPIFKSGLCQLLDPALRTLLNILPYLLEIR